MRRNDQTSTGGVHKKSSRKLAYTDNSEFSQFQCCIVHNIHMNKEKNDNSSNLEILDSLDYGIDKLGIFKSWTQILCINSANYESFGFMKQISLHHI